MRELKQYLEDNISMIGIVCERLRKKKGYSQSFVCEKTGIPTTCYNELEAGVSTRIHKRICILSDFWKEHGFPEATEKYLILGTDNDKEKYEEIIKNIESSSRRGEMDRVMKLIEIKSQLDIFHSLDEKQLTEIASLKDKLSALIISNTSNVTTD